MIGLDIVARENENKNDKNSILIVKKKTRWRKSNFPYKVNHISIVLKIECHCTLFEIRMFDKQRETSLNLCCDQLSVGHWSFWSSLLTVRALIWFCLMLGSLAQANIAAATAEKGNKRKKYAAYTPEDRYEIGMCAVEMGPAKTVCRFK